MLKKNTYIGLVFLFVLVNSTSFASKKLIKPYLHNRVVQVKSGEKSTTSYYSLSRKYGTKIKVNGPGRITLYLRSSVVEGEKYSTPFTVKYTIDGKKVKVRKVKPIAVSVKSKIVRKEGLISVVKKISFTIPPGKHFIDFIVLNNESRVYSKYYFEKFPEPQWKTQPLTEKGEQVILVSTKKNKENIYYRVSSEKGISIKAKEKTYLRIMFRAEFKAYMFSDNTLRLHIKENGKIIKTIQISSTRAKYSVYKHGGKLVPGTLNRFYMTVPKGNHEYEIVVADKSKTALVKISFDEKRYPKKIN
ncbi:MAG: hypothetical protein CMD35_04995 [Flavobacteriales bacterium]|nr:hypothetical protein [Flavobacteriales bacterium]